MAADTCSFPCVKGCVCKSGFLLYNGSCIPRKQCECWHEGNHYPEGSEFWINNCTTKCTCPRLGSPVVCMKAFCPKDSYCGLKDGVLGCLSQAHGVCRVHGDPHYSTFDQASHHFLGNCTYILAKVCGASTSLPRFVIAAKNEYMENPPRSFVHKVFVEIYGNLIEIHKDIGQQVIVDEMWRTLPVRNANGSVTVSKSGRYISIETDFNLIVNYDADHLVEVRMPHTFSNMTCGMCGNFNHYKEDDAMMPNGKQAENSTELGKSWRMPHGKYDHPFCGSPNIKSPCTTEEEDIYRENGFCGMLTNTDGPFQECHVTVNPEIFFDICLRDMCTFNGNQKLLCNTLGAYSDACQRSGILLDNWRLDTFCLFLCPSNSEHKMCTSACPATCANPLAPNNCTKSCVEGCQCHEGYKGQTFWRAGCAGQCLCAENGTLVCTEDRCPEDQICKVDEGVLGCNTPDLASCHIFGDPHYITFDGTLYHFEGSCNYTLVETFGQLIQQFSVTVRNERQDHQNMTVLNSVAFSYQNLHITLRRNKEVYEGPFRSCHSEIPPSNYVLSCVYDQCASEGNREFCRKSMEAYVTACGRFGIDMGNWWNESLCESVTPCNFSCSFDTNLCLWTQSTTDHFDWTQFKGSTPSEMTGPTQDHTTGGGQYLYIEGNNVIEGNVAHLVSPTCTSSGPFCFSFWYHMFGSASLMSLRVYVHPEGEEATRLWVATGRKQNKWLQANVTIPNTGRLKEEEEPTKEPPEQQIPDILQELFQHQRSKFKADLAAALEPIKIQLTSLTNEMSMVEDTRDEALKMGLLDGKETNELQSIMVDFQKEIENLENHLKKLIIRFHGTPDEAEEEKIIIFLIGFLNKICPDVHVSERDFEIVYNSQVLKVQEQTMARDVIARGRTHSSKPTVLRKLRALACIEYGDTKISMYQDLSMKTLQKSFFKPYIDQPEEEDIYDRRDFPFYLLVHHNGRTFLATTPNHIAAICGILKTAVQKQHQH
ncbi:hypothetical protein JD844_007760 [Phrynosoma platyrhinos]|uniref:Zonadhesin n=1 Tax=Phrynosoma platyrhinos TaxID=52577 RepID=A0ABQ7T3V7_PHRPL|nr:hypothetical protein JD844_007760 [Phrynosoma platyrhinos]